MTCQNGSSAYKLFEKYARVGFTWNDAGKINFIYDALVRSTAFVQAGREIDCSIMSEAEEQVLAVISLSVSEGLLVVSMFSKSNRN